jgi:hypothetical protein
MKIKASKYRVFEGAAVCLVTLLLISSLSGSILAEQSLIGKSVNSLRQVTEENDEIITSHYNGNTITKRKITASDIEERKKIVGVCDPNKNYNFIIDHHVTGVAPPTEEQWNDMVGQYEITKITNTLAVMPPSVDWSSTNFFPEIGEHGQWFIIP